MNLYVAFTLFALIILLYWVISELFSILFRFTGLPAEKARFQVTSLLTGCGYTTRESEMFVSSKSRRRMARITMLFGYVFNITVVSALINVFLSMKESQVKDFVFGLLIPLAAAAVIIILMRVPAVRSRCDIALERLAGRVLRLDAANSVVLMDYVGKDVIARVVINEVPKALEGIPLAESGLKSDNNILVMLVEKPGKNPQPAGADTIFEKDDKLTVFGDFNIISRIFNAKENFSDIED